MAVFMISLAGVPPTGGFWGKLLIFQAAIERGGSLGPVLAVVMLVNSVVSVFYYLLVPREMFLREPADRSRLRVPALVTAVVGAATIALVGIFVLPNPVARLAEISSLVGLGP
jgi:NADH-quinone oxidoreductase subunit N